MRRRATGRQPSPPNPRPEGHRARFAGEGQPRRWAGWWPNNRRDLAVAAVLLALIGVLAAGVARWRPAVAENDPYLVMMARWTVGEVSGDQAFVGLGVFTYRPNWDGPEQTFPGPVLLQVVESSAPVRARFSGEVTIGETGEELPAGQATAAVDETVLARGDLVALPAGTGFAVTTGEGETVRLMAIAILPGGPPSTPGIEQAEWRAWGIVKPAPETPLVVSVYDLELAGGETYQFRRDRGPALLSVDGSGDGAQSIAMAVFRGRGTYLRVADVPPFDLEGPVTYRAVQTPTTSRERVFDARSGAFLPAGATARLRNRSLVDGTGVVMVTFDGPNVVPPAPTATPVVTPTPLGTRPPA